MNRLISQKFRFLSFICIALLLYVHGYNLKVTYLQPFTLIDEPLSLTTFTEYFLANGLLRFRLPMLFTITGYIFALQDKLPYTQRIRKRFFTLVIPYLIWSAAAVLLTFLLQQFPVTATAVQHAQIDQLRDYRPYTEIGWTGVLHRWLRWTPAFQLWFIRSLFFYNLLYPVFRWGVTRYPIPFFVILFAGWISFFNFSPLEGQGMLFYAFGIWLSKTNYAIHRRPEWFGVFPAWLLFIGLNVVKTFMAFEFDTMTVPLTAAFSLLYVVTAATGVVAVWYSSDTFVLKAMQQKWVTWLVTFSFFIYVFHVPLLPYLTHLVYLHLPHFTYYRLLLYIGMPALVLGICVGTGALLRKTLPRFYQLATGGRGF